MTSAETAHHHPAHKLYLITIVLLGLTVLLGFIAVFVPWAMKDIAVGKRAWAYPFKTCIEETFSTTNTETCMDNDFMSEGGVPLTGGSSACRGWILSTIAFVFISVLLGVVVLLALVYVLDQLWTRPTTVAALAQIGLIIVCIACFLSWIMFLVYSFQTCAPNSIFPVYGYSYGFIIYLFATATCCGAVVTDFMANKQLRGFVPVKDYEATPESPVELESPAQYPEYPEAVPLAPTPQRSFNSNTSLPVV